MLSAAAVASLSGAPVPPVYRAPRLAAGARRLPIDADLDKPEWAAAPWSEPFGEIRGADAPLEARPPPTCVTRMKMLWDDEFLYVCAILESDFEIVCTFTERNSPIFQRDSDFEIFVDAAGSCHAYKELEVNAANVVWNLMLDRPYADGGGEHSARVAAPGDARHYEVRAQRSATRLLRGALNSGGGGAWAVEMALAHEETVARQGSAARRPAVGGRWRVNFSRVERRGEVNWTWGPQVVWEPRTRRYEGKVNMHLPDAWGHVEFAPPNAEASAGQSAEAAAAVAAEPAAVARGAAMGVYYAMHAHREAHGSFAKTIDEMRDMLDGDAADACELSLGAPDDISAEAGAVMAVGNDGVNDAAWPRGWRVTAVHRASGVRASVTHERLVTSAAD